MRVGLPRASGRPYGCSPHVGSIQGVRAEGAGGSRARSFGGGLRHGGGGSGLCIRLTTGPPERIAVGEEVEDGGERRAGAAGGGGWYVHSTVAGGGEGDVTDAGAAAAPVPSEGRGPRQMLP